MENIDGVDMVLYYQVDYVLTDVPADEAISAKGKVSDPVRRDLVSCIEIGHTTELEGTPRVLHLPTGSADRANALGVG